MDKKENQKKQIEMILKEEELWISLRDRKNDMYHFIRNTIEGIPVNKNYLDIILVCIKACLSKYIIEEGKWELKKYDIVELVDKIYPIVYDNKYLDYHDREEIRKEIWGYISFISPSIIEIAHDYLDEKDRIYVVTEEKSTAIFACVIAAWIEVIFRKIEFDELQD